MSNYLKCSAHRMAKCCISDDIHLVFQNISMDANSLRSHFVLLLNHVRDDQIVHLQTKHVPPVMSKQLSQ